MEPDDDQKQYIRDVIKKQYDLWSGSGDNPVKLSLRIYEATHPWSAGPAGIVEAALSVAEVADLLNRPEEWVEDLIEDISYRFEADRLNLEVARQHEAQH